MNKFKEEWIKKNKREKIFSITSSVFMVTIVLCYILLLNERIPIKTYYVLFNILAGTGILFIGLSSYRIHKTQAILTFVGAVLFYLIALYALLFLFH